MGKQTTGTSELGFGKKEFFNEVVIFVIDLINSVVCDTQ